MNAPYQVMPDLVPDDYASLKADIAARGVQVSVEYDEAGNILDGHHRVRACTELGITTWPRLVRIGLSEEGKWAHARALNLARRHLTRDQRRELIAAQLRDTPHLSNNAIANMLKVDDEVVASQRALLVTSGDVPETGTRTDTKGRKQPATKPKTEKPKRTAYVSERDMSIANELPAQARDEVLRGVKTLAEAVTEARRSERMARLADIGAANMPLSIVGARYPVIYADPPWRYEQPNSESRAIENHYPTMPLDEVKALPVADIAFDDCVLFMWATSPKLAEAMQVIDAWGFTYRTCAVWDKQKIGMGHYVRQQTEHLLIAIRGEPPAPAPEDRPASLFSFPRGEHSAKPVQCYAMIERMYPGLPKLELFARSRRDGWAAWGNQSGAAA